MDDAQRAQAVILVENILDDALEHDRGFRTGEEYSYINPHTGDKIITALENAGLMINE